MQGLINGIANIFYLYDNYIIFITAIINIIIWVRIRDKIKKGEKICTSVAVKRLGIKADESITDADKMAMKNVNKILLSMYSLYANITAIFPLLGIIGTVASLVRISENVDMMDNLMVALTTTLLGVFFAILFKTFDALISGKLEDILDDADFFIHQLEVKEGNEDEE